VSTAEPLKMTIKHKAARAATFEAVLAQLTLAFEPYATVAEVLAALDRAGPPDAPEVKETAIVPLWEEPAWTEAELVAVADVEPEAAPPACHYTHNSGNSGF
jgi:hypothetical protein